jgi:Domain of unknown function (DUF1772)
MGLRLLRLSSILSIAIGMSAAFAHLMEMPAKMRYDPALYVKLHRTLYPNFGRIAGAAEILSVLSTAGLALWLRQRRSGAFPSTAAAAGCLAAAHGTFWVLVYPANTTMFKWQLDSIPAEWIHWRNQWEYSHAARAILETAALGTLAWSVMPDNSGRAT